MYNLIEYSNIHSKKSKVLWKYYRYESALDGTNNIIYFPANNNNSVLFKLKRKITGQTGNDAIKDIEIMLPLKNLFNFWKTLELIVKLIFSRK